MGKQLQMGLRLFPDQADNLEKLMSLEKYEHRSRNSIVGEAILEKYKREVNKNETNKIIVPERV